MNKIVEIQNNKMAKTTSYCMATVDHIEQFDDCDEYSARLKFKENKDLQIKRLELESAARALVNHNMKINVPLPMQKISDESIKEDSRFFGYAKSAVSDYLAKKVKKIKKILPLI